MADVGCEFAVCWEMSRANSRVIGGLFSGPVDKVVSAFVLRRGGFLDARRLIRDGRKLLDPKPRPHHDV